MLEYSFKRGRILDGPDTRQTHLSARLENNNNEINMRITTLNTLNLFSLLTVMLASPMVTRGACHVLDIMSHT